MRYQRGDINSTMQAAQNVARDQQQTRYIVPTAFGFSIEKQAAPFGGKCYEVKPDGTAQVIGGFTA